MHTVDRLGVPMRRIPPKKIKRLPDPPKDFSVVSDDYEIVVYPDGRALCIIKDPWLRKKPKLESRPRYKSHS